jgi:MFS family permease
MSHGPALSEPALSKSALPAHSGRWTIVWLLFAASVINYFDRATISFALPLIAKDLSLGPEQKGLILSSFFWSYALMQIPMGIGADRWNMRWLYAGAFVLWSVAQGLAGFATTLAALIFFRILLGIGEAIYLPGGTKIVSLLFRPSERGLPCGIFDFGTRTGLVLEALLVPWMLTHLGWQVTFQIIGFTALIWLFPWFWATPKQLRGEPAAPFPGFAILASRAWALARNRDLIGICIGFFFFDYFWYLIVTWLPDYLVTVRKMNLPKAGLYASLPFLVFGLSQVAGGWLADTLVRRGWDETRVRKGIISLAFLTGLLLIPAALAENDRVAVAFLMGSCLVGLSTPNMLVVLQHCAPPDQVGLWTGIFNFVGNLAGIAAPLATGYIVKATGSYTPAFVLAAVAIAVGQLAFWFIVRPLPGRQAESA